MPALHLLGTGAALSDPHRTTTMLALADDASVIVVDCGGDVVQRLLAASIPLESVEALVITHEHPDHVSGFPLFMEKIWIAGRRRPIPVHGPAAALSQARRIFEAFETGGWRGLPEIRWSEVPLTEDAEVLSSDRWHIRASPGTHSVPVIGLRFEHRGGRTVAYSSDTEPSDAIRRLAADADILVHEATGDFGGHSSASQAAEIAAGAGAKRLLLVHLPPDLPEEELRSARAKFSETHPGEEGSVHDL